MCTYLLHMVLRDLISLAEDVANAAKQVENNLQILQGIKIRRTINNLSTCCGSLWVSFKYFSILLRSILSSKIIPTTLYHMGRYRNGASLEDVA
jgi:hypothetical protein